MRHGVVSDWKFFLDDEQWFGLWAHRYGESGAQALAQELRRLPWRVGRDPENAGGAQEHTWGDILVESYLAE